RTPRSTLFPYTTLFRSNNDGSFKVGFTAASVARQAEVIAMAQAEAAVEPETITYIEAHGTGTPLGDPIEIAALTQVFQASCSKRSEEHTSELQSRSDLV